MSQAPSYFSIQVHPIGERAVWVSIAGELDLASVPAFKRAFAQLLADEQTVLLDLSQLDFMDSSGIHALIAATHEFQLRQLQVEVSDAFTDPVKRILDLTGVMPLLPIVSDAVGASPADEAGWVPRRPD